MRDKLNSILKEHFSYVPLNSVIAIADSLLEEEIIISPIKIGQHVLVYIGDELREARISSIIKEKNFPIKFKIKIRYSFDENTSAYYDGGIVDIKDVFILLPE